MLVSRRIAARGIAQPGRAPALGAGGRRFESCCPDHYLAGFFRLCGRGRFSAPVHVLFRTEEGAPLACSNQSLGVRPFLVVAGGIQGFMAGHRHHALLGQLGIAKLGYATMAANVKSSGSLAARAAARTPLRAVRIRKGLGTAILAPWGRCGFISTIGIPSRLRLSIYSVNAGRTAHPDRIAADGRVHQSYDARHAPC